MLRGAELARAILRAPNRYALLSLGCSDGRTIELGADGFLNHEDEEVRKCYTRLAVHCHPDRCADVPDATKAFQALVRAYELTCKPDLRADDSEDSRSEDEADDDGACPVPHFTLSRSFHHTALVSPGGEQATASAGARTRTAILPTPVTRTSLIIQRALPSYCRRGRGSRSQHAADRRAHRATALVETAPRAAVGQPVRVRAAVGRGAGATAGAAALL